jgi:hypothetical protein
MNAAAARVRRYLAAGPRRQRELYIRLEPFLRLPATIRRELQREANGCSPYTRKC